jgi:hypothetical protein
MGQQRCKVPRAAFDRLETRRDVFVSSDFLSDHLKTECAGGGLNLAHFEHSAGIAKVGHDCQTPETGYHLAQKFDSFAAEIARQV